MNRLFMCETLKVTQCDNLKCCANSLEVLNVSIIDRLFINLANAREDHFHIFATFISSVSRH